MRRRFFLLALLAALPAARPAAGQSLFKPKDWYTIVDAAHNNNLDQVLTLLSQSSPVDETDEDGRTALSYAAANGNVGIAQVLIEHGARTDLKDRLGNTALHWAAVTGHSEIVKLLLAASKAEINAINRRGETPVMMAAGRGDLASVKLLVDAGADLHKQDYTGRDVLGWSDGRGPVAQYLRQKGLH